ncbi:MAG: 3-oxoacyl-ACP reductase [Solirubrobacteraceae bacterium]
MEDKYLNFVNSPLGKFIAGKVGLPEPVVLERYKKGQPIVDGSIILGSSNNALFSKEINDVFSGISKKYALENKSTFNAQLWNSESGKIKAAIYDASGIKNSEELIQVYNFFNPIARYFSNSGKIVILGLTPELLSEVNQKIAQRALLGFTKAIGKEIANGVCANIIYAENTAGENIKSSLRFFASNRSAFVSGQFVEITAGVNETSTWDEPLKGKNVLVTGAARGIGRAIAEVMSRDGANVLVVDVPQAESDLKEVASLIGGDYLSLDITSPDAAKKIAEKYSSSSLDILVHNAGVTRDKKLANMKPELWNMVININLTSQERINADLISNNIIKSGGKIVTISSISGIAGNLGQTNYAMSKAGVIGLVEGYAPIYKEKGITINAVAPGFIETKMTAAIPFATREAGRRLSALTQGGQPEDVAETIAWLANPSSQGINGQIVRVCGLSFIGA